MKKPDQAPPWRNDPLSSEFFAQAQFNERAASLNYPDVYALLQEANSIFAEANAAVEKDSDEVLLLPRFFVVRTRAAFLAAARLAMAGEIPEAFPVLRLAIELAWYALHIAQDPSGDRSRIWMKRGDSKGATTACKNEFTVRNVRTTHESVDPAQAARMQDLYESMIDLGAHPNQLGLFSAIGSEISGKQATFQVGILYPVEFPLLATLTMALLVAYRVLLIFQLIFPERFKIMRLDDRIAQLVASIQRVVVRRNIASPDNST